jgi:2-iminobutanoate/2-iminopropanoate deaminase
MVKRQVLEVPGVSHNAPIPMGAKIGKMICSSGISGMDPETHTIPPDPAKQAELMFRNLRTLLEAGGASPDNVAHMTVFIKDNSLREHLNVEWNRMFPDEHDRPARHTLVYDLGGGMLIQCEVMAVLD